MAYLNISLSSFEAIDGAQVIKTTARHKRAGLGIRTRHDPAGTQGNGVDLVGGVSVPDNQLTVLK